jgi:hypothetical protein
VLVNLPRVVALSSIGHRRSAIRWDDMQFEHGYDEWQAYGQSETANALFAEQLDALALDAGVTKVPRDRCHPRYSARRCDRPAGCPRRACHPLVVGDDLLHRGAKLTDAGEMNRVQRA